VTVALVAVACGNFRRAFWARSEWRCRPGTLRVCRAARAAASPAAAIASSDDEAVTWVDVMERTEWRQTAVKDSSSAVTRAWFLRRSARAAATSLRSGGAGAHELGAGQPGPGFGDDQPRGPRPQHRPGRAVPGAGDRGLVLAERGLRRAPPGQVRLPYRIRGRGLVVQEGGDDTSFRPVMSGYAAVVEVAFTCR
jgi:hypothetical protein